MLLRRSLLAVAIAACSASSAPMDAGGPSAAALADGATQPPADAGPLEGPCADLNTCVLQADGESGLPMPGGGSTIASARNTNLCQLALGALQAAREAAVGEGTCNGPASSGPAFPSTKACKDLLGCCPSITEPVGTAACEFVAKDDYWGDDETDACTPAIKYFQGKGFCASIDLHGG